MEEVSFGNFSDQEVNDLYTQDCGKIEFVWQKNPSSPGHGQPARNKELCTQAYLPADGLSPNSPPYPPTSPSDPSNADDNNKKLNINAMPFVPGSAPAVIPPNDEANNKTLSNTIFIGTSELEGVESPRNETRIYTAENKSSKVLTTPITCASASPPTTTAETRHMKPSTPTPPHTAQPAITAVSGNTQTTCAWSKPKPWAAILGSQSNTTNPQTVSGSAKTVSTPCYVENVALMNEQMRLTQLKELAGQLTKWTVSHNPVNIQPRGLVNQGNWCYMHAPLQALLSCPGFYNLFQSLATSFPGEPSPSPVTDTMIQLVHEFKPYPKVPPSSDLKSKKKVGGRRDLQFGDSFRPDYVYDMLHKIKSSLSVKGRQEDAEEFLGCVLDSLHEEMLSAKATMAPPQTEQKAGVSVPAGRHEEGDDVEWEQVGPKNKSAITRQTAFKDSPIAEIFGGELRSSVHRQKAKESATLQPFFSLQLDIQSEKVWDIKDALEILSAKETVHMSETEAYKKLSISRLPPVLILHLKRFVFDKTGGSQKLLKQVQYSTELEISKELLYRGKLTTQQRSYQLWSVVYHHGKTATGGHYTCDLNHPASGGWIRADDNNVRAIPEEFVLKPPTSQANKVAYILFYRRTDTIRT